MRWLLVLLCVGFACGGSEKRTQLPPKPAAEEMSTRAQLAGHRCSGDACRCRKLDSGEDAAETMPPDEGLRRFEFRVTATTGVAWVTVDGTERLYKGTERPDECFYLDLAPGHHPVNIRAQAERPEGGVGIAVQISQYAVLDNDHHWYRSFDFQCGAPGPCAPDDLKDWKQEVTTNRARLRDPCGTVRPQKLEWETGRMPDGLYPEDVTVRVELNVLQQPPLAPPGTGCPEN